ncbi:unnamed protein product [Rhizoctonia solani]|uniref:Uncharacterized protein n=1 Tax=Rhizoctonia solani TaxID=456999 RepID=A0A8H3ECR6_9AGAM|nr:unnamed protein product [Rhizoctonia solani]
MRPKVKQIPRPQVEEEEPELEVEGAGDGADQEEEELEPLPESLVPEITRKLATGWLGQKKQKGGNGDGVVNSNRLAESHANSSEKASSNAINLLSTEELIKSGQARPIGTMPLKNKGNKAKIPPSDRTLRHR